MGFPLTTPLGKTLRGSYDRGGRQDMIHMAGAWASENRLVLGQRKVNEKSNEITAISELLKVPNLNQAVAIRRSPNFETRIRSRYRCCEHQSRKSAIAFCRPRVSLCWRNCKIWLGVNPGNA